MERKEAIRGAYRMTGGNSFYDGMITCSTLSGKAVCRLVWAMNKAENDAYLEKAMSGIPEHFSGKLLEVPVGTGILTMPVYQTMPEADITCLDYSPDMMRQAREKADRLHLKNVTFRQGDVGHSPNPMAYNELFALAFVAPYVASEKKIPPTAVQEMMRRSLYHIKWYFAKTDLNTDKGKAENKKSVVKYAKWYTPEKEAKYPTSFKVDFVGQPYEGACYYRITRCPICIYAEKLGVSELMPLFCELDEVMITLQHGVLHRKQTLANGGEYCDYFITGNRE